MHFLLHRSDHIGDVILTLPMAKVLKQQFPQCKVTFLAKPYVKDIVTACPHVDDFIDWEELNQQSKQQAIKTLKKYNFDVFINVFPRSKPACYAAKAKIPLRIGTARRWYHWLYCNRRVNFTRAKSILHEAQLNLKLLAPLNIRGDFTLDELYPELKVTQTLPTHVQTYIDRERFNVIVHPGSHGNGREWPTDFYVELIRQLTKLNFNIIITGSTKEKEQFQQKLLNPLQSLEHVHDSMGQLTLTELMGLIGQADALVAASTGPLHLAAALGIHAIGLYVQHPLIGPARWQPIGPKAHVLQCKTACKKDCQQQRSCPCMRTITVQEVKDYLIHCAER